MNKENIMGQAGKVWRLRRKEVATQQPQFSNTTLPRPNPIGSLDKVHPVPKHLPLRGKAGHLRQASQSAPAASLLVNQSATRRPQTCR